jgi:IS1 family transposase
MAKNLATEKKVLAVSMLAEGSSIRSIERVTQVHRDTIMRLGVRVGEACAGIHDNKMRNVRSSDIQIDEIWGFIGKKKKQTRAWESGVGDVWTFIALDAETKLIPAFLVGQRTMIHAREFLRDLAGRLANRIQLSSNGFAAYRETGLARRLVRTWITGNW